MPRRSKVEFRTPKKGKKKRRRNSKRFDSAPVPVGQEIKEVVQEDTSSELILSWAPISERWPDEFCLEGVVLNFGIQGNIEPIHMKSDAELMPPPKSWIVPKARMKALAY